MVVRRVGTPGATPSMVAGTPHYRRESKQELVDLVRNHWDTSNVKETDVLVNFLYSVSHQGIKQINFQRGGLID